MEILNQSPIMEMDPSYKSLAFKLLVAIIIGFFATVFCVCCGGDTSVIVTGGFTALCAIALFVLVACAPEVPTDRNKYEVKLDETIDINEFYDKYEVIERRDKIWVIEDREAQDDANS